MDNKTNNYTIITGAYENFLLRLEVKKVIFLRRQSAYKNKEYAVTQRRKDKWRA